MPAESLTPEQNDFLTTLAIKASEDLESSGASVTNRAFNQGCFVGLLPAGLFLLLTYLLTRGSLAGTAISCVLMLLALVIFANLAASIARHNTSRRIYQERVQAEIDGALAEQGLSRAQFDAAALECLPREASLRDFLTPPAPENTSLAGRLIQRIKSLL
jgi:hypothetical protein